MPQNEEEFLKQLLEIFKVEAKEHIDSAVNNLIKLEKSNSREEIDELTEIIFREIHSLKGASRSVDFLEIESLCQNLESVFRFLKDNYDKQEKEFFDFIHRIFDIILKLVDQDDIEQEVIVNFNDQLVEAHQELLKREKIQIKPHKEHSSNEETKNRNEDTSPKEETVEQKIDSIDSASVKKVTRKKAAAKKTKNIQKADVKENSKNVAKNTNQISKEKQKDQYLRLPVERLNQLMLKLEDMLSVKLTEANTVELIDNFRQLLLIKKKELKKIIARDRKKSFDVGDQVSYPEAIQDADFNEISGWVLDFIKDHEKKLNAFYSSVKNDFRQNAEKIDDAMDELRNVLMLPFSTISDLFPKMVRDLARDEEKEIRYEIIGEEVEIDKRILDELKDPLIHLIRNSIDHGIEAPDERKKAGKNETGVIAIRVNTETGNRIKIEIEDDGLGINAEKVYKKAIGNSLIDKNKELTEYEKLNLIFESGISTNQVITDLSGRGLGLAIVKEKVDYLGGKIKISTSPGKGTKFIIELPASRATFRGIITLSNKRFYVFPTSGVERVIRISIEEIKSVENKSIIVSNGISIPVFNLQDILQVKDEKRFNKEEGSYSVLIIGNEKPVGFIVDEVVREQELMLKGLGKQLKNVTNVMGATVMGDGKIATVIYIPNLLKNASKVSGTSILKKKDRVHKEKPKILIAEDSITSRMLLVNILETAGYDVTSTVDGSEALSTLRENKFDLVVSDVDMPNMNGFELTRRIRSDEKLKEIPLILVTALKSRADKEMGMDVGANAYIVKSSFKPETLLNTIKKFV